MSEGLCESCAAGEHELHARGLAVGHTLRKFVAVVLLAPLALGLVALLVVMSLRALGVLPLAR